MAVQVFLILRAKTKSWEIFYLGCFSMLLGIWKITDTRFTPLMFPDNPLALGYITIGMLFLSAGPLLFFAREHFPGEKHTLVGVMSLICCAVALGSLLCQVLGIAEFRQTLAFAHASIILTSVTLAVTVAVRMGRTAKAQNRWFENPIWILTLGVASDLIRYYYNSSSSGVVYTLAAFLIYTAGRFVQDFLDINRMAKTDALTGLFNKSHWDQLMGDEVPSTGPVGLVMFDLNRLKQINDTLGHEMGDKALSGFSTGRRLPEASGSPSSISTHFMPLTEPLSSTRISVGFVRRLKIIPSSFAWCTSSTLAGSSSSLLRYTI